MKKLLLVFFVAVAFSNTFAFNEQVVIAGTNAKSISVQHLSTYHSSYTLKNKVLLGTTSGYNWVIDVTKNPGLLDMLNTAMLLNKLVTVRCDMDTPLGSGRFPVTGIEMHAD